MFGLKIFTKTKNKRFSSNKERKRYFAIQDYYNKAQIKKPCQKTQHKNPKNS